MQKAIAPKTVGDDLNRIGSGDGANLIHCGRIIVKRDFVGRELRLCHRKIDAGAMIEKPHIKTVRGQKFEQVRVNRID